MWLVASTAAALVAALVAVAPPAHAAKGMEVTLQDDAVFLSQRYGPPGGRARAFEMLKPLQVSRLRVNLTWYAILPPDQARAKKKPRKLAYDFSRLDNLVAEARARRLRINLAIVGQAPAWATANRKFYENNKGSYKPKPKEFAKFASLVARRYRRKVDTYSIWNEPNHKGWIQPVRSSGRIYKALYKAGYRAIKKADRRAKVWFGELAPYASKKGVALPPLTFLRQMFGKRARCSSALRADGFAHHPYDFRRPPTRRYPDRNAVTMANLGTLTKTLDRLARGNCLRAAKGRRAPALQLTEYGYFASKPAPKVFPESRRAKYLVQAFRIAQRNRRVKSMLQFLLIQYPAGMFRFDTSIVRLDGTPTASYTKLARWATSAAKKRLIKRSRQR